MPSTPSQLKNQADAMFTGSLLRSVKGKIDTDAKAKAVVKASSIRTESVATGWFGDALCDRLGDGHFEGRMNLVWNGMDLFVFVPDPKAPFSYTTSDKIQSKKWTIAPGLMDTDGGSIPRALRGLAKFSSWGTRPPSSSKTVSTPPSSAASPRSTPGNSRTKPKSWPRRSRPL